LTRRTVRHYQGFARGRRKRLHEPDPTVKHLLYAYRALLTGIHLMTTGEVQSNLANLNDVYGLAQVPELMERKREGAEKMLIDAGELPAHDVELDRLEDRLQEAHDRSALPDEPTTAAALDELVVRVRLDAARREQR
jgi:predicted nucleotidyltransferase